MSEIDLSILVVSYNTRALTLACLASVYEQTQESSYEVIVVDNQSADDSAKAIAEQYPQVRLICTDKNIGFAAANNMAAREARGQYLMLLNPDTYLLENAADHLLCFAKQNSRAGIWGGRTLYPDGRLNPYSCWARPTLWSSICLVTGLSRLLSHTTLFNPEAYGGWKRDSVREVDIVTGCFFLIRKQNWDRLGGFDAAFFMYGEEADLCLRARAAGLTAVLDPDSVIVHYGGASETVQADKMVRLLKAKVQLMDRHWNGPSKWLGKRLLELWPLTRMLAFSVLAPWRHSWRDRRASWRSIWLRRDQWRRGYGQSPNDIDAKTTRTVA